MRIDVTCPRCCESFDVREKFAGKRVECKSCGGPVHVPGGHQTVSSSRSPTVRKKSSGGGGNAGLGMGLGIGIGGTALVGLIIAAFAMSGGSSSPPAPPPAPMTTTPVAAVAPEIPAVTPPASTSQTTIATVENSTPVNPGPAEQKPTSVTEKTVAEASTKPSTSPAGTETSQEKKATLDLPDLIAMVEPSVVRIDIKLKGGGATGSGFVVDDQGTVVTNYHVIAGATGASVKFLDGGEANVLGVRHTLPKMDIAIIKIDAAKEKLHPISLAKSFPKKGTSVVAFGSPEGFSFSATEGIVSGVRTSEEIRDEIGIDHEGTWVQTSSPTSGGMSGGPLTDRLGNVVGMNTWGLVRGQNLNFTISSLDIAKAIETAPEKVVPLNPNTFKEQDNSIARKGAVDEVGTARGQKLLSQTKEIFVINGTSRLTLALDPTGAIWDKVIRRSQVIVERCKIDLSFGRPADDAAVMIVIFKMKPTRKGTLGTQELSIEAELICLDPDAKKSRSPYSTVWKDEETIGTISLEALATGNFPRAADDKLAKFFQGFQSAYLRSTKEPAKTDDAKKDDAATSGTDKPSDSPFSPKTSQ